MATPFRLRPSISLCAFRSTTKSRPFFLIQARFESTSAPDASSSSTSSSSQPLLSNFLVTPQALNNALKKNVYSKISTAPRVIPLCAAWFMPNDPQGRNGRAAYLAGHIPRARFFDIDAVCDKNSPYPHMLPSPELFADAMGGLGIRSDDSVVVYDTAELGIFSAPRVAWTLKVFGHHDVHILNNFKLWVDQGFPIEKGEPEEAVDPTNYPVPNLDATKLIGFEELKERVQEQGKDGVEEITIIDARNQGRWEGSSPEPREGLSSGHIPKSYNIPFTDVLNARTKAFLPAQELRVYFECKNVDDKKPIISTCGTGVTACVLDAALTEAGYPEQGRRVYDGSWTEWASRAKDNDKLIIQGKS